MMLLHLRIQLGIMRNFVNSMNKSGNDFMYLKQQFPRIGVAKKERRNLTAQ